MFEALDTHHHMEPVPRGRHFRLAAGSALVDAGIDVGVPYAGRAPALGAFEGTTAVALSQEVGEDAE